MRDAELQRFSDEDLARLAAREPDPARSRRLASVLLGRRQRLVYVWCRRMLRDPEIALEQAQEVLLSAYRSLGQFEGRSRFTTWLFTIARNQCLRHLRAPSWTRDDALELESVPDPHAAGSQTADAEWEEEEVLELLRTRLTPLEQEALWLRCFERYPVDEITRRLRLGTSSGARGLLQTARRKLRAALDERKVREEA